MEHKPAARSEKSGMGECGRQRPAALALELLDELDQFRRQHQDSALHPPDWCMRVMEAIVARAFGYESRNSWTEQLLANPQSRYYRAFHVSMDRLGLDEIRTSLHKTPEQAQEAGQP